jgi:transposase
MNETKGSISQEEEYSENYSKIRKEAESKWPAWKISTYNASVAVSTHAKKIII